MLFTGFLRTKFSRVKNNSNHDFYSIDQGSSNKVYILLNTLNVQKRVVKSFQIFLKNFWSNTLLRKYAIDINFPLLLSTVLYYNDVMSRKAKMLVSKYRKKYRPVRPFREVTEISPLLSKGKKNTKSFATQYIVII